jgi:hypothetical protein
MNAFWFLSMISSILGARRRASISEISFAKLWIMLMGGSLLGV